jgi:hypothetical protein
MAKPLFIIAAIIVSAVLIVPTVSSAAAVSDPEIATAA